MAVVSGQFYFGPCQCNPCFGSGIGTRDGDSFGWSGDQLINGRAENTVVTYWDGPTNIGGGGFAYFEKSIVYTAVYTVPRTGVYFRGARGSGPSFGGLTAAKNIYLARLLGTFHGAGFTPGIGNVAYDGNPKPGIGFPDTDYSVNPPQVGDVFLEQGETVYFFTRREGDNGSILYNRSSY